MLKLPTLAAIAIVLQDEEVLLVRRKNEPDAGLWGFPGGHVELGETTLAAASRELYEETGIIAEPIKYLTNVDVIKHDVHGDILFHFLLAAVECTYVSGIPQAADDAAEARWFAINDIFGKRIETSKNVDDVIHIAINSRNAAVSNRSSDSAVNQSDPSRRNKT